MKNGGFFMAKKLGRNGNGEGSVYNTIQKAKKKFDNTKMCPICLECKDRSFCSNRTNWEKCSKCKECTICLKKVFAIDSTAMTATLLK